MSRTGVFEPSGLTFRIKHGTVRTIPNKSATGNSIPFWPVKREGGAVAQAASMSGVPFAVVRAISDLADGTAAASFEQFEQHAADVSAAAVLQALALLD